MATWDVTTREATRSVLGASLPMAGLKVTREVTLKAARLGAAGAEGPMDAAFVEVREGVSNVNPLGRVYNMVQHPSIAPPFLHDGTLVDCNGKRGFFQGPIRTYAESPTQRTFEFPASINRGGREADVRTMTGGDDDVQSYEVSPGAPFGWVCATSGMHGLVLGYVWPTSHYPWISLWCSSGHDGAPRARGLEFGTTGLHQPPPILARHPRLFGLPTFEYIDTGETHTRSYASFLLRVPPDFLGVGDLTVSGNVLTLIERSEGAAQGRSFTLTIDGGSLFGDA